ncbi:MAG: hypothetical protein LUF81_03160, partial [Clostridiales bacterium]|nr:hypothetical protein [Clostridiales bacterium]
LLLYRTFGKVIQLHFHFIIPTGKIKPKMKILRTFPKNVQCAQNGFSFSFVNVYFDDFLPG